VVHVHELAGLPSSVLDIARRAGAPVLFTLQDYFPLCPTFKLIDSEGRVCLRAQVGGDCVATVAADKRDPGLLYAATAYHDLTKSRLLARLPVQRRRRVIWRAMDAATSYARRRVRQPPDATAFQRRRDVNVERLNRCDKLIGMSNRVSEIYAALGVDRARLHTAQFTLAHIEHLRPRTISGAPGDVTFATLGGGESAEKGARVILDAVGLLADEAAAGRFRLLLCGLVSADFVDEARATPGVVVPGVFTPEQLDSMLDSVDVGLMPSVWEEAYGYAGVEFLAKGIPVIANAIGGMTDYVRDGETGWLNHDCDAPGLAAIMRDVIEHPGQIVELNAKLRAERDSIVMSQSRHASEMDTIYRELLACR
jgi:glycosyltransferase involved in cell wall biosynthesis